ncbi:MAG: 4-alpha-glucanotransferase [Nocardioidaceae bacterium]
MSKSCATHFGFPGMRILQYALRRRHDESRFAAQLYKQLRRLYGNARQRHNRRLVYIRKQEAVRRAMPRKSKREREFCLNYLKSDGREIHWDFIRAVWASVADTAIAPMQDLLGLGNEARMNLPASSDGKLVLAMQRRRFFG